MSEDETPAGETGGREGQGGSEGGQQQDSGQDHESGQDQGGGTEDEQGGSYDLDYGLREGDQGGERRDR
ncbi:MAG TPA: hypothetical protein VMD09_15965 [Solirubrobacteraceae bacterium]|nr:hypothetical protein [Solirubrobacteraceae bacterium]